MNESDALLLLSANDYWVGIHSIRQFANYTIARIFLPLSLFHHCHSSTCSSHYFIVNFHYSCNFSPLQRSSLLQNETRESNDDDSTVNFTVPFPLGFSLSLSDSEALAATYQFEERRKRDDSYLPYPSTTRKWIE